MNNFTTKKGGVLTRALPFSFREIYKEYYEREYYDLYNKGVEILWKFMVKTVDGCRLNLRYFSFIFS